MSQNFNWLKISLRVGIYCWNVFDSLQAEVIRLRQTPRRPIGGIGSNLSDPNLSGRLPDDTKITDVNKSNESVVYAIFISYVEIYNNYIYDLLETDARDIVTGKTKLVY